jgi:hypothetical protein
MLHNKQKIVVFDLDETLGYFIELGIFWDSLHNYAKSINVDIKKLFTQNYFNNMLDIFPEFIRPNIMSILEYVKLKKKNKQCHSVMIYTNNQGPKEWSYFIKNYFEDRLKYKLFNQVISAFKVNGKVIEVCRTSNEKNIKDFMRCSKLPENVEICYLDDNYFPDMNSENVYYIKIKPYSHDLPFEIMIHRFTNSDISKKLISAKHTEKDFSDFINENVSKYEFVYNEKSKDEYDIDKIITKKTMVHLQSFFNKNKHSNSPQPGNKKTLKNRTYKTKTRKNQ